MVPVALSALPLASVLPDAGIRTRLLAGGDVRSSVTGKVALSLAPAWPGASLVKAAVASEDPDVAVEAVFFLPSPAPSGADTRLEAAYSVLRGISSLQGIEYFSESRGRMRLFYEESWRIASPDDRTRVPDDKPATPPVFDRVWAWQKDLSFGGNVYEIDYAVARDLEPWSLSMKSTNVTGMRYGIIPVAGPRALSVRVNLIATDEGLVFWAVSTARAAAVPGMRGKLEDSFGNRAAALFGWFSRVYAAGRL
ncbi:MAG: hypothetical protein JXA15_08955 [Spirochaetales bacterium]|nr:hypothetical protein [Spirochaetales bacterium]